MAPATRPVSGQPIETTWGDQVHDVAVMNRGVVVTGAASSVAATPLPLDTVVFGDPTMVDLAANNVIAPVDGIYEIMATLGGTGQATGGSYFAHVYEAGGSSAYQSISGTAPSFGGSVRRFFAGGLILATAGQRFNFLNSSPGSGGSIQLERMSWRLVAAGLGAS